MKGNARSYLYRGCLHVNVYNLKNERKKNCSKNVIKHNEKLKIKATYFKLILKESFSIYS